MNDAVREKTPVHLWAVAIVSTLWNSFGAVDYTMTQMNNEAYLSGFTEAQRAYFTAFPAWAEAFWALGVWGALLGSLLLLARSRHAVTGFAVSLLGLLGSSIYQFVVVGAEQRALFGTFAMVITAIIWLIAIALFAYARRMKARGLLA